MGREERLKRLGLPSNPRLMALKLTQSKNPDVRKAGIKALQKFNRSPVFQDLIMKGCKSVSLPKED